MKEKHLISEIFVCHWTFHILFYSNAGHFQNKFVKSDITGISQKHHQMIFYYEIFVQLFRYKKKKIRIPQSFCFNKFYEM